MAGVFNLSPYNDSANIQFVVTVFSLFVSFFCFNALMAANHKVVVGDQMWQGSEVDLPDSRFVPFRTDHFWTSREIRDWVQSMDGQELSAYELHNAVALQIFLGLACLQWCLVSVIIPVDNRFSSILIKLPIIVIMVKIVEVICIGWLVHVFSESASSHGAATQLAAAIGSLGTSLKVWLTICWVILFAYTTSSVLWRSNL